jgi:DNA (cytosine-5)-methyltransferase 1
MRPRLLDLFCGAGGAAMGYHCAGFDVVGVDNRPQPHYPFPFVQSDALEYCREHGKEYDAIHASPPCQAYSISTKNCPTRKDFYPDMMEETRNVLTHSGRPFVIENVPRAPLRPDFKLCGCQFGVWRLKRERWFEVNFQTGGLLQPCCHLEPVISVCGHGTPSWTADWRLHRKTVKVSDWRRAMGIYWMTGAELSQSIPPAYTEFIGRQLIRVVGK